MQLNTILQMNTALLLLCKRVYNYENNYFISQLLILKHI